MFLVLVVQQEGHPTYKQYDGILMMVIWLLFELSYLCVLYFDCSC